MKICIAIVLSLIVVAAGKCYSQTDTILVKQQKGLLFLSSYNYLYDYKGGHTRPLGFHDFFYPTTMLCPDSFKDSNINIAFQNGIRVDRIIGRFGIKNQSLSIDCIDTSHCYLLKNFYVVPVIISYKMFKDYEPFVCQRNFYELQVVNGAKLRFEYLHKALIPTKIVVQKTK